MKQLKLEDTHEKVVEDKEIMAVRQNGKVWNFDGTYLFGVLPETQQKRQSIAP